MKVFWSNNFKGHYPIGTAAVVVAKDAGAALVALDNLLASRGLKQTLTLDNIEELDIKETRAILLQNGDY